MDSQHNSSSSAMSSSSTNLTNNRNQNHRAQHHHVSSSSSSLYPLHPPDSHVLLRYSAEEYSWFDKLLVHGSSLIIVGSVLWVPAALYFTYRAWRRAPPRTRRQLVLGILFWSLVGLVTVGPHRHPRIGEHFLQIRKWSLWKAWMRFVALEVIQERRNSPTRAQSIQPTSQASHQQQSSSTTFSPNITNNNDTTNPPIFAFCPHGIFPFAFGMAAFFEPVAQAIAGSYFRPIIASAVRYLPVVNTLVSYARAVDASRGSVYV